jgi:hypothetical protein
VRRLVSILALGALFVAPAAAAPNAVNQGRLDQTVRYLQEAQQSTGGFGAAGEPSQITSAWTALALAAAGINPQDQRQPGGVDAHSYLASHFQQGVDESDCAPIVCTTTFERELMVANASCTDPHSFGGVDLVTPLLARARPDGAFPHVPAGEPGVNDTIFAVFALAPIQEAAAQAPIQHAADWIESAQLESGGWAWRYGSDRDEVDMTGAAIQALVAAGRPGAAAVRAGVEYLHRAQNPDGGLPEFPGNPESNAASTAWATQAIWAVGENPEDWRTGSGEATEEPLDYLESLQEPDGHIRWKRTQDLNGVWMTAYTTPAFGGHPWPIPCPPRALSPAVPPTQAGQGGEGLQAGAGAIAGGGGRGAPLFSRPQPQSRGRTPGGARVVADGGSSPTDHSESRRGENRVQPRGTARREAQGDRVEAVASVSAGSADSDSDGDNGAGSSGGSAAARDLASTGTGSGGGSGEVAGVLVDTAGSRGRLAFGAPGLHGSGASEEGPWVALGIGAAALSIGLLGAWIERRRPDRIVGARA